MEKAALAGALRVIAEKGGGVVNSYPLDLHGKSYGSSFLAGGTSTMFAKEGFHPVVKLGTTKLVMRKFVRKRKRVIVATWLQWNFSYYESSTLEKKLATY